MNIKDFFIRLTAFEWLLWLGSVAMITVSYLLAGEYDVLTLIASLIGVTALIFTAKGNVLGPVILIFFSLFYGYISFTQQYYGEIFTYVGMSAPVSAVSVITWLKNPYSSSEVKTSKVTAKTMTVLLIATVVVTHKDEVVVEEKKEPVDDNKVFDVVEQNPVFPGGEAALLKYVAEHIRYPAMAQENNIQGRVCSIFASRFSN